jgi:hypothetical protein
MSMPEPASAEGPKNVQNVYTAILNEIDRHISPLDVVTRQRVYRLLNTTLTERITAADRTRHELLHKTEATAQPP